MPSNTTGPAGDDVADVNTGAVSVGGVRSPFLHAGPTDDGEAVLCVHGNPGPAEDWRRLVARVGVFARAVAPEMPGYGAADKPTDFAYTVDGYARHLHGFAERAGIHRAHLVLHDFGGPWGLAWAARHPELIGSITLVNMGVLHGYRWHSIARAWRTPLMGELTMRAAMLPGTRLLLRHGHRGGVPPGLAEQVHRSMTDPRTQRAVLRLYRATDLAALANTLQPMLRRLDVPVLVVWGAQDPYVPVRYAARQRETFPSAQVVILDGSGHWPMHDDPGAFERPVLRFLRRMLA